MIVLAILSVGDAQDIVHVWSKNTIPKHRLDLRPLFPLVSFTSENLLTGFEALAPALHRCGPSGLGEGGATHPLRRSASRGSAIQCRQETWLTPSEASLALAALAALASFAHSWRCW